LALHKGNQLIGGAKELLVDLSGIMDDYSDEKGTK